MQLKQTLTALTAGLLLSVSSVAAAGEQIMSEQQQILHRLTVNEIPQAVSMDARMQALVTTATLTALGDTDLLRATLKGALDQGIAAVELRETIIQGMAYCGMSYTSRAEKVLMDLLAQEGLDTNLPPAAVVNDDNRFTEGLAVQKGIFGAAIDQMHQNAKDDEKALTVDLLTGWCFGDTYTRTVLPLKEREYLTFVYIAALGGCEPQVKAHAAGNIAVGNTRQMLTEALTVMVPYIGFPKTLNALAMVNEACPE